MCGTQYIYIYATEIYFMYIQCHVFHLTGVSYVCSCALHLDGAVKFLYRMANELNLPVECIEVCLIMPV